MAPICMIINSLKQIRRSPSKEGNKTKEARIDMRPAATQRVYEDFVPSHELVQEEGASTLLIEIPDYRKEQLRVQIDNYGKMRISGERPLGDNRWSRFRWDFQVPENCNVSEIRAKYENGRLYVILPKLITEVKGKEEPAQAPQKPKEGEKPTTEPKQEDEKRAKAMNARKEAQEVGKKEKEQTEEKKHEEKVADVVSDVRKKKVVPEPPAAGRGWDRVRKLVDERGFSFYKPRRIMVTAIVGAVVLVGVGLYVIYKLRRPMEEDGH